MSYNISYVCVSHVGKCRKKNQDNFMCVNRVMKVTGEASPVVLQGSISSDENVYFGVFDGMGGEEQGEMAAYIAADALKQVDVLGKTDLGGYCKKTNAQICTYAQKHRVFSMGTTAAILRCSNKRIELCNVGDSKIFRIAAKEMEQISEDHVLVSAFGTKPKLYQNLGIPETEMILEPYLTSMNYRDGDMYLICSDGLTDMVTASVIKETLGKTDIVSAGEFLLQEALENGGKDNITFIILKVQRKYKLLFRK